MVFKSGSFNISNTTKGILWMLVHCLALVLIMGVVRTLTKDGLSNYIIIAWQNIFAFLMIAPYCAVTGGFPKTKKLHLHIARACSGISSGLLLFYSMGLVKLNLATAITFTGPLFTTIFAIIFFREKTYTHRVIGLCIGFGGVLIVLRPWDTAFNPNALYLVLTAALWGVTDMFIKLMNRTETIRAMMFYRVALMLVITVPFIYFFWQPITIYHIGLLTLLAALDLTNFWTVTKAYRYADISVLMPFDFSRLIFSAIFAFIVLHENLNPWTVVGSAVIVYGTVFVVYKEKKRLKLASNETM